MIIGCLIVSCALLAYLIYNPKEPNKNSLNYYKQHWRFIDNYYSK